jgi:hypothetical protein
MNSEEPAVHKSDRVSPSEKPRPTAAQDIIDVQIVEGVSAEVNNPLNAEPLEDLWANDEPTAPAPPTTPPTQSLSPDTTNDLPPESISPNPPMSNIAQESEPTLNLPTLEPEPMDTKVVDNWAMLLDEIDREPELPPESIDVDEELDYIATSKAVDSGASANQTLEQEERRLKAEIAVLQETQAQLQRQIAETQASLGSIAQTAIADLEQRRQKLQISVEQLERRRDRIQAEIDKSFVGSSQEIAIRLQGFKDYLVGSLQDLVTIAEDIEFPAPPPAKIRLETPSSKAPAAPPAAKTPPEPQFIEPPFKANAQRVKELLHQYRNAPDYYAPTWQLRRTFEPVHQEKVANWFLKQGGRGAVRSLNSRLQNILVASGAISVLRDLYGDYLRTLVLANLPERLGDWRRGLQDCLGISKSDFGGNGGVILFEDPEALVNKADRIIADREMPLIIVDDSEGLVSLSLLEYPLWLAFAPDPQQPIDDYREYR